MGFVLRCLKRVSGWVAGSAALLAGLSTHGLTALVILGGLAVVLGVMVVILAVLGCGLFRWIIGDGARSDRVNRLLLAKRGDAGCLKASSPASSSPASRRNRRRAWRRSRGRANRDG